MPTCPRKRRSPSRSSCAAPPPSRIAVGPAPTAGVADDRTLASEESDFSGAEAGALRSEEAAPAEPALPRFSNPAPPPPPSASPVVQSESERRADYGVAGDAAGVGAASGSEGAAYSVAPAGWQPITVDEARRLMGGRLAVPAGATVVSASRSPYLLEVRTVQRTSRGETIEVVQRPYLALNDQPRASRQAEAPEAAAAAAPDQAKPSSTVRWGDWTVTISGPVSADRLEELSDALP